MLTIPCRSDLRHYTLRCALDGATYALTFRWNLREQAWYFDLADETGVDILVGVKVVVTFPLAIRSTDARRPPGLFIAMDTTGQDADPGEADLGNRVSFLYAEASDRP